MSFTIHAIALAAYLTAAVFHGANLSLRAASHGRTARFLLLGAFLAHTAAIGSLCVSQGRSPFVSAFGTLSVAAWAVALFSLIVEFGIRLPALGALSVPISCFFLFAAFLRSSAVVRVTPEVRSGVISIHVMLVLLSFALLVLASCCAVFYLWQYSLLKRRRSHGLFRRLPPLETADSLAYHLVAFALPLLTLGLVLGIERAAAGGLRGNWLADPHTIGSAVLWLVYGAYLGARTLAGWRGTRPNYVLVAGMAITIALYFVPSTAHHFM
jgi:ABC-type uncharacterized transport system permease subunit